MALQYFAARGIKGRHRLLTVRGGYHGDTFGAMAVCDPVNGMHSMFQGVLPQHLFAPRPATPFGHECTEEHISEVRSWCMSGDERSAAACGHWGWGATLYPRSNRFDNLRLVARTI